jgi:hypothetical protein
MTRHEPLVMTSSTRSMLEHLSRQLTRRRPNHSPTRDREIFTTDSTGKVFTMARSRSRPRFDDDDIWETVIGFDGEPQKILRDGCGMRISMMDAQVSRAASDARIAEAVEATHRAIAMSGVGLTDAQAALHRPGFRDSSTYPTEDPGPGGELPPELRRRRRKTIYRDPQGRERSNDSLTEAQIARMEMIDSMTNAWRTADTRALKDLPEPGGRWPLDVSRMGEPCDSNGSPGTLQPDPTGKFLTCVVTKGPGPTRAGASMQNPPGDSVNDARTEAWKQMCEYTFNAWRT